MLDNLSILVDNLGAGQLALQLGNSINEFVSKNHELDIIVFYDHMHRQCIMPNFTIMQMAEAWCQAGPAIATSIATAIKLVDFPGPDLKMFYVWDLEWMRGPQRVWGIFEDVFTHEDLVLIARCEEHKKVIDQCFNVNVPYIVEDASIPQFIEALREEYDGQHK